MPRAISPNRSCDEGDAVEPFRTPDEPADELLTGGGLPRWFQVAGALLAVGVLVLILATKLTGSTQRSGVALPTTAPTTSPAPTAFGSTRAFDVVLGGDSQWSIEGDLLVRSGPDHAVRSVSLAFLDLPVTSRQILALDQTRDVVWLVVANAVPSRMIEFDSRTLRSIVSTTWEQVVDGAAAVNGYLYLANSLGVAEVSPYSLRPRPVPGLLGAIGPVLADPAHHQLLAIDSSNPIGVWSYQHGHRPRESEVRLPMGKGSLAVANGAVWVGGFGERGAMLYRLDPRTLLPLAGGRAPDFDPGAVLVAGGRQVIWLRTGSDESDLIACLDARTGRIEQSFHLADTGAIASTGGYAVVATAEGVLPLALDGCTG